MSPDKFIVASKLELDNPGLCILECMFGYIIDINIDNCTLTAQLNDDDHVSYEAEISIDYFEHDVYRIGTVFDLYIGKLMDGNGFMYVNYLKDVYTQEDLDKAYVRGQLLASRLHVI